MSDRASLNIVRVTAAVICAFGFVMIVKAFAGAGRVFPGAVLVALLLELPLLVLGYWLLRLLRPVRAPARCWSAAAVIWGMTAATGCALLANDALLGIWAKTAGIGFAANWGAALTAPLDEEILKLCGVAMIALAAALAIRGPVDGLIFGGLVGLGFQVVENLTYGVNAVPQFAAINPPAAAFSSAAVRIGLTGLGAHWAMTAVAGAGIGYLAARGRRGAWLAAAFLLAAMAMHLWFDSPPISFLPAALSDVTKAAVNLAVFLTVYLILRHRYLAGARSMLAADAAAGIISEDEAHSLLSRRRRRRARRPVHRGAERHRLLGWQQAQLERLEGGVARRGLAPVVPASRAPMPSASQPPATRQGEDRPAGTRP
jgi:RsiW-degrading membrane proteinase PrsW (M82 family)